MKIAARNGSPPVFVTYGWCRTAYAVMQSLARRNIEVHVGDASGFAMCRYSRFAKSFTALPDFYREPERYFEDLCAALVKTGSRVLIPAHEDIGLIARWRNLLPDGVQVCLPSDSSLAVVEDRRIYMEAAERAGIPVPATCQPRSIAELDDFLRDSPLPLVVKTLTGSSAKGVFICQTREECRRVYLEVIEQYSLENHRWPLIQQHLPGEKVGVIGYFSEGTHVSSLCYRIVRSKGRGNFGTSTFREVVSDPEISANAARTMQALGWNGAFDMDWLRDSDGVARLVDINGRLGGSTIISVVSGMELPYLLYLGAMGELPERLPQVRAGTRARWILGDGIGFLGSLFKGDFRTCLSIMRPWPGCWHDDFLLTDPLPFVFQSLDYLVKFFKSGGSTNPVAPGMIR